MLVARDRDPLCGMRGVDSYRVIRRLRLHAEVSAGTCGYRRKLRFSVGPRIADPGSRIAHRASGPRAMLGIHQHPSCVVRLLFEHCPETVEDWSVAGSGWISRRRSWRDKTAPYWDERLENAVERPFRAVPGAFRPVASRMQRAKKLISSKTKARVATSNPQRSLLCNRRHGYETAQRSTARHDRRRHRPSGPRASAIRPSLAGRARRRYAPGGDVIRTCRELHACARQIDHQLVVARHVERDLLVCLGPLYPVDRLAVAALQVRAARSRSRDSRSRSFRRALLFRPHRRDGGRTVVALLDAQRSLVGRGEAVRAAGSRRRGSRRRSRSPSGTASGRGAVRAPHAVRLSRAASCSRSPSGGGSTPDLPAAAPSAARTP